MKLADIKLAPGNHFVAMEYHGLILNRTLLILVTDEHLIGIVANGLISASAPGSDPITALATDRMVIHGDLNDPLSYLSQKYLDKAAEADLLGPDLTRANRANFRIRLDEISAATHDPAKKWGMGQYPHDGKVYVTAVTTREFIVLGNQSGSEIANLIRNKAGLAGNEGEAMSHETETDDKFASRVSRLEALSKRNPAGYKLRVLLLALLGYGYLFLIIAALAGAVLALGMLAAGSKHLYIAAKVGLPLLILLGVTLRALWVRLEEPAGIVLTREQAPPLFAVLDDLRARFRGPRFHTVLLTDEFNAGVLQIPRLGIFGWQKNFLILGMPLMQALSPEQFKAVIAHEYGHLAGSHSRFNCWIYRVRKTWHQIMEALEKREGWLISVYVRFFRWYAPFFSTYSFVLARANEYEADRVSAQFSGARHAADALLNSELKEGVIRQGFWPEVYGRTEHDAHPTLKPYGAMPGYLADPATREEAGETLQAAMRVTTDCRDTHPALADRLSALGESARVPDPINETAAQRLFGASLQTLTDALDAQWQENVAGWWRERHAETHGNKQRHASLKANASDGVEMSLQDLWDYAVLTEEFEGEAAALPRYREVLVREPEDPAPLMAVGRLLLERDDPEGVALLEKSMEADESRTERACVLLYHFSKRTGNGEKAEAYRQRAMQHEAKAEASKAERASLHVSDDLLPHGLNEEALAALREQLRQYPRISKAFLVRKAVQHYPESPIYVLGVAPPWWYYSFDRGQKLVSKLIGELQCPGETFIILTSGHDDEQRIKIGKRMKKIDGALIFRR